MFWFWLNMPLAAAFFGAWCGIPLRMVLRHPNWGPEPADSGGVQPPEREPVLPADRGEHPAEPLVLTGAGR
jgi:hypothetical protein